MKPGDRYELLEKIATGSFATVYRAHDNELGREVAVKQIHEQFLSDPRQLDRYWSEAQLLASLQHPNIVTIYDIVREKGWLIMELMQGNLADRMQGRAMDLVALRTVLAHCLRALKFLHEHGIVHGDVKPSNMLVDRRKRLKLGDFGLARRVSDDEGSLIKGTTKYMAPEVVSDEFGEVGPASDLYSLGFATFELMCGSNFDSLFPGLNAHGRDKQLAWIMWHAAADRKLPPISRVLEGVPEDLARVVQKLATKNPAQRYQSADAALADLNVDLRVVRAEDQAPALPPVDPAARRRKLIMIAALSISVSMSLFMLLPPGDDATRPKAKTGVIREISVEKRELVVVDDVTKDPEIIKLAVKPSFVLKDPLIKGKQERILLRDVKPGDRVRVVQKANGVEFVLYRPLDSMGTLLRIEGVAKLVVIETDDGAKREEIPIQIGEEAQIKINGEAAKFIDLQEQDRILIQHLPDARDENRRTALNVAIRRSVSSTGSVRTLNASGRKLSFDVGQGSKRRLWVYPFAKDCQITLPNGTTVAPEDLKPDDLQTGDRVSLVHDTEITKVVATRNQTLIGTIKTVNRDARTVGIQTRDGKQHVLNITPETKIAIDVGDEPAEFHELREYDEVTATFEESDDGSGLRAVTIDATRPGKNDRLAIVIGVQNYDDKAVTRTTYILDDVQLLENALRKRYRVTQERMLVFKDANKAQLQQEIDKALQETIVDTQVIIYFEGQAFEATPGKYFLATRDFQLKKPAETGLPLDWLVETLEKCASQDKLLVLDTFQVGSAVKYDPQPSPAKMLGSLESAMKTMHAIAARGDNETGQEWPEKGHGSFAWQVAQGIKGAADANQDLHLKPQELQEFLQLSLSGLSFDKARPQTPKLFGPAK